MSEGICVITPREAIESRGINESQIYENYPAEIREREDIFVVYERTSGLRECFLQTSIYLFVIIYVSIIL